MDLLIPFPEQWFFFLTVFHSTVGQTCHVLSSLRTEIFILCSTFESVTVSLTSWLFQQSKFSQYPQWFGGTDFVLQNFMFLIFVVSLESMWALKIEWSFEIRVSDSNSVFINSVIFIWLFNQRMLLICKLGILHITS